MYVTLKYLLSLYGKLIIFSCIIYTLVVLVDRIVLFHCSNIDLLDCWKLVLRYLVVLGRTLASLEAGVTLFDSLASCGGLPDFLPPLQCVVPGGGLVLGIPLVLCLSASVLLLSATFLQCLCCHLQ